MILYISLICFHCSDNCVVWIAHQDSTAEIERSDFIFGGIRLPERIYPRDKVRRRVSLQRFKKLSEIRVVTSESRIECACGWETGAR